MFEINFQSKGLYKMSSVVDLLVKKYIDLNVYLNITDCTDCELIRRELVDIMKYLSLSVLFIYLFIFILQGWIQEYLIGSSKFPKMFELIQLTQVFEQKGLSKQYGIHFIVFIDISAKLEFV